MSAPPHLWGGGRGAAGGCPPHLWGGGRGAAGGCPPHLWGGGRGAAGGCPPHLWGGGAGGAGGADASAIPRASNVHRPLELAPHRLRDAARLPPALPPLRHHVEQQ